MRSILDEEWVRDARRKSWLVGVSGGRDSVVLLDSLVDAGFGDLVVVHVEHGLRGEAGVGDAEFVRELAARYGVDFRLRRSDVGALAAEAGKGIELMAREVRHRAFVEAAREFGAEGVLLGHHADDQVETVLFNLCRGGDGLRGMREVSEIEVAGEILRVVRPLLGNRRAEIEAWGVGRGLKFREDATNAEGFTARNRIRNEVLPLLNEVMGRDVAGGILGALEGSLAVEQFVDGAFEYGDFLDPQGRLFLPALLEAEEAIRGRVIYRYLREGGVSDVSREVVGRCVALLDADAARVNLPGGGWLRRRAKRLFIDPPEHC